MTAFAKEFATLERLADGLLLISETDAPLVPFVWPQPLPWSPGALLAAAGQPADTPLEVVAAGDFFARLSATRPGQTPEERASARRFGRLAAWLESHLADVQVYRVGAIAIDTTIAGRHPQGRIVGLTTRQVET
jgi:hypothetical protein